jgi:hypothetical protein
VAMRKEFLAILISATLVLATWPLPSPNAPPENRMEPVATCHYPLKAGLLLSDRNRADLD